MTLTTDFPWISAFSGVGGFEHGLGEPIAQIEKDPNARTILQRHYPTTRLLGDIHDVTAADFRGLPRPVAIGGGFPCQDTSIGAPHRLGLAGKRSGCFFPFAELVDDLGRVIDDQEPEWVFIENPPGLLKSNDGQDMGTVIRVLSELGYVGSWRLVDPRFLRSRFGSVQRRPRVLLVGHRGSDPTPARLVLGDPFDGDEAVRSREVSGATRGPRPAGDPAGDVVVWRKAARPRAALSKGGYETWVADGMANTLTGFDGGNAARQTHLLTQAGRLRTWTPHEWERLQGLEPGWTDGIPLGDIRRKGELIKAGRWTLLGNMMHAGMAGWFGDRLISTHRMLHSMSQIGA